MVFFIIPRGEEAKMKPQESKAGRPSVPDDLASTSQLLGPKVQGDHKLEHKTQS